MPPKQKWKNGFFFFMNEFKEKSGRNFKSMQEVALEAGPHWSRLSKEERRPYEEKALMQKNNVRSTKYTCTGQDVREIEFLEKQEQNKLQDMKDDIYNSLMFASKKGGLKDQKFFIIHINQFCYCTSEEAYYPAEIAISYFSLQEGVLPGDVFHRCISPGKLPMGYAHEANLMSKETHQLPPPIFGEEENNMEEVYTSLRQFLRSKLSPTDGNYIFYCDQKWMKMVEQTLEMFRYKFHENCLSFKVYNLQYMFRMLKNFAAGENIWMSDTFGHRVIEKDVFSFASGLCCEMHDIIGATAHCSRSIVIRYAYLICDNCCADLNIELVPGVHIPNVIGSKAQKPSRANSMASLSSIQSSSLKPSTLVEEEEDDDDTASVTSFSSVTSSNVTMESNDQFPLLVGRRKRIPSSQNSFHHYSPSEGSTAASETSMRGFDDAGPPMAGLSKRPMDFPSSVIRNEGSQATSSNQQPRGRGRPSETPADVCIVPMGRARGILWNRGKGFNSGKW